MCALRRTSQHTTYSAVKCLALMFALYRMQICSRENKRMLYKPIQELYCERMGLQNQTRFSSGCCIDLALSLAASFPQSCCARTSACWTRPSGS